jgi:biotin operon repressor
MMEARLVTTDCAAKCLSILKSIREPIVAADLAVRLGLEGERETQRRHVRAIVKHLRESGAKIVASLQGGYWLTEDDDTWKDYLAGRAIDGKRIIAEASRKKRQICDKDGQGILFMPGKPVMGYA